MVFANSRDFDFLLCGRWQSQGWPIANDKIPVETAMRRNCARDEPIDLKLKCKQNQSGQIRYLRQVLVCHCALNSWKASEILTGTLLSCSTFTPFNLVIYVRWCRIAHLKISRLSLNSSDTYCDLVSSCGGQINYNNYIYLSQFWIQSNHVGVTIFEGTETKCQLMAILKSKKNLKIKHRGLALR